MAGRHHLVPLNTTPPNFDALAGIYRALEFLAFGRDLESARFHFLPRLAASRRILVLGEGDGRCLMQLLRHAPRAQVDCLDLSAAMLARAAVRLTPTDRARVRFQQADLLTADVSGADYDAIITFFFFDCFTPSQVATLLARLTPRLAPGALWLWADFTLPPRGFTRWRARAWLAFLYTFFHWQTGLAVRALPPTESLLLAAGCDRVAHRDLQSGLLRTALFRYQPHLLPDGHGDAQTGGIALDRASRSRWDQLRLSASTWPANHSHLHCNLNGSAL